MAATGFSVGLGNIWRFPYVTGENGGSAFVLIYLFAAFAIGVPILMSEIMIGRRGGATPPMSMREVALASKRSPSWAWLGYLNLLTGFAIAAVYTVVTGWVLFYLFEALWGGLDQLDVATSPDYFNALLADIPALMFWGALPLVITGCIIAGGVAKGIERAAKCLMPLLILLLLSLVVHNVFMGGMPETLDYLFSADFSKVTPATVLTAVGHAFFSIGVGMGAMMMYGAYLPPHISITTSAVVVALIDTSVALIAGLVIFPMVFHHQLDPAGGAGLIFQTLPIAFAQMPAGGLVAVLFFLLLGLAALSSLVGLCEPLVAWVGERFKLRRIRSLVVLMGVMAAAAMTSVLSYNLWQDVTLFGYSMNWLMSYLPDQFMLPLGGFLIALFAGWFIQSSEAKDELNISSPRLFALWHLLMRFAVVPALFIILLTGLVVQ